MKDFLVTNHNTTYAKNSVGGAVVSAYDGTNGVQTLDAGCLAFFEQDGTLISSAVPAPSLDKFYIAVGRVIAPSAGGGTTTGAMITNMIDRGSFSYTKKTGVAAQAMVARIGEGNTTAGGFYLPSSTLLNNGIYVGQEIGIIIDDLTRLQEDKRRRRRYSYVLQTGDTTRAIALGHLVDVINARKNDPLTVIYGVGGANVAVAGAADHEYILLQSKTSGASFRVIGFGLLENATSFYTVAEGATLNVVGSGTYDMCVALEKDYLSHRGRVSDRADFATYWWKESSNLASANAPYTLYVITHEYPRVDVLSNNSLPNTQEIVIAVPNTHTNTIAWMDTILAAL